MKSSIFVFNLLRIITVNQQKITSKLKQITFHLITNLEQKIAFEFLKSFKKSSEKVIGVLQTGPKRRERFKNSVKSLHH